MYCLFLALLCKPNNILLLTSLLYLFYSELLGMSKIHIVFVCARSSLSGQIRRLLQKETKAAIEIIDLPEFDIRRRYKNVSTVFYS